MSGLHSSTAEGRAQVHDDSQGVAHVPERARASGTASLQTGKSFVRSSPSRFRLGKFRGRKLVSLGWEQVAAPEEANILIKKFGHGYARLTKYVDDFILGCNKKDTKKIWNLYPSRQFMQYYIIIIES